MGDEAFKQYRRTQLAELRPYVEEEDTSLINIGIDDLRNGSPQPGDMIARNPENHGDQWLVSKDYFEKNFALVGGEAENQKVEQ